LAGCPIRDSLVAEVYVAVNTVLVAIDFSEQSQVALAHATAIARRDGASLTLLWVDPDGSSAPAPIIHDAGEAVASLVAEQHAQSAKQLAELVDTAVAAGVETGARIERGHPDEVIVAVGEEISADLIVTGTKGLTGFKRFFLGSVAERVVRTSHTHVLVARGPADVAYRRILVPTDFSAYSRTALRLAVTLVEPGGDIDLFHAWQYPPGTHGLAAGGEKVGPLADLRDDIIQANDERGADLVSGEVRSDITVHFVQQFGPAGALIQDRIRDQLYDLIVMGTHGYRGFRRFLLGSVAEATVRHATCSVLVVHAGADDDETDDA
jgi:nucleotide-binding universal stress UspA family protein